MKTIEEIVAASPVIPIVTVGRASDAVSLARALVRGGIRVVEITLRTAAAMDAIRAIAAEVPEMLLGAGTVLSARAIEDAARAGAVFALSPGTPPALLDAVKDGPIPFLPGVSTPSEIAAALDAGIDHLKLFPAQQLGGVDVLRAYAGPFPEAKFCPTGGVTFESAASYLALKNVVCVGGSWLTPATAISSGDFDAVERLARQAATLAKVA